MAWVRIDDGAMTHPKIVGLTDRAFRLWVWGLSYCQQHLTDGLITPEAVPGRLKLAIGDLTGKKKLWEPHDVGYKVHDYLDWNDSRETVLAKRAGGKRRLDDWRDKKTAQPVTTETRYTGEGGNALQRSTTTDLLARSGVGITTRSSERKENGPDVLGERAGILLQETYPQLYAKYRHGARLRLTANSVAFNDALSLVEQWDDARLEKLAALVLTTDDEWISRTDRGFKIFALKASWADDRLAAWEKAQATS